MLDSYIVEKLVNGFSRNFQDMLDTAQKIIGATVSHTTKLFHGTQIRRGVVFIRNVMENGEIDFLEILLDMASITQGIIWDISGMLHLTPAKWDFLFLDPYLSASLRGIYVKFSG